MVNAFGHWHGDVVFRGTDMPFAEASSQASASMPWGTWAGLLGGAQAVAFLATLAAAAFTDLRHRRVPNAITLGGLVLGLLFSLARGGWNDGPVALKTSLAVMAAGFVLFVIFYALGAMGAGDVKLIAAVGALTGNVRFFCWGLVYTAIAGLILALVALVRRGGLVHGLGRGFRQMGRWRYDSPPPDGRPPFKSKPPVPPPPALPSPSGEDGKALAVAGATGNVRGSIEKSTRGDGSLPIVPSTPEPPVEAAADDDAPVYVPYAVAIAAGFLWAAWQYARRGLEWPFFLS